MEKSFRKCAPKASPRPLINFGNWLKTAFAYKKLIILKIRYFEKGLSKSLKKVNFVFSFEPSLFSW